MSKVQLIIAVVAATAAVVNVIVAVVRIWKESFVGRKEPKAVIRMPKIWIPVLIVAICGPIAFWLGRRPYPAADTARYGFESGTGGWVYETYPDSQGVTSVVQSTDRARFGRHSLRLAAELEGGHRNRSKGETYMEIPRQNLKNKPITVWVYVPKEAIGDPTKPNGIQVFVKDEDWRGEYGTWWNTTPSKVDSWQQVTLTPSTIPPPDGWMDPGFDPNQIRAIGVKVAIGDGSIATYKGPIYIDAVDWPQ